MPPKKIVAKAETKVEPKVVEVVEVKVTAPTPDVVETADLGAAFTEFTTKLAAARTLLSTIITDFKTLQKRAERESKAAQKAGAKRKHKSATRAPSGFVKPTLISDQLAEFLTKPKGSLIARTEVTREINAYIRSNKLQDPDNGRKINPDAKLKKLLTLKPTDELTYFNLQRYMSQHFQKTEKPVVAAAAATPIATA
jgi:chromatin remodeling complex protein RSC6